jgi:hypothetical protein
MYVFLEGRVDRMGRDEMEMDSDFNISHLGMDERYKG